MSRDYSHFRVALTLYQGEAPEPAQRLEKFTMTPLQRVMCSEEYFNWDEERRRLAAWAARLWEKGIDPEDDPVFCERRRFFYSNYTHLLHRRQDVINRAARERDAKKET